MTMIRAMPKCLAYHPSEGSQQVPTHSLGADHIAPQITLRSRWAPRYVKGRAHAREQIGAGPGLGKERQGGIECVFTAPRPGVAAGEKERRGAPVPPVDLIEPAPAEPAHNQ